MYQEILEKLPPDKVVGISYADNPTHSSVGFILGWDDTHFLMGHISAEGYYDGYILRPLEGICSISLDGTYEQKIQKLYLLRKQSHSLWAANSSDMTEFILQYAQEHKLLVSVHVGDHAFSGLVSDWSDSAVELNYVDEYGTPNGTLIFFLDEIDGIDADSAYEQSLRLLMDHRF